MESAGTQLQLSIQGRPQTAPALTGQRETVMMVSERELQYQMRRHRLRHDRLDEEHVQRQWTASPPSVHKAPGLGIKRGRRDMPHTAIAVRKVSALVATFAARRDQADTQGESPLSAVANVPVMDRDRVALKLGRLIMTAMLEKEEGIRPTSRFFLDKWLHDFKSDANSADAFSVELVARLEHASTLDGGKSAQGGHNPSTPAASNPTRLRTAVACEALDAMCEAFGAAQPALVALRAALYPAIFSRDDRPCPPPELIGTSGPETDGPLSGCSDYADREFWFENDMPTRIKRLETQLMETQEMEAALNMQVLQYKTELKNQQQQAFTDAEDMQTLRRRSLDVTMTVEELRGTMLMEKGRRDETQRELSNVRIQLDEERKQHEAAMAKANAHADELRAHITELQSKYAGAHCHAEQLGSHIERLKEELSRTKLSCQEMISAMDQERDAGLLAAAVAQKQVELETNRCQSAQDEARVAQSKYRELLTAVEEAVHVHGRDAKAQQQREERLEVFTDSELYAKLLQELASIRVTHKEDITKLESTFRANYRERELELKRWCDTRVAELLAQIKNLEEAMAKQKAEADSDRTTLSRQLFYSQTQHSEVTMTVQRLQSDLQQINLWKRREAEAREHVSVLQMELDKKVVLDMEARGHDYRRQGLEAELLAVRELLASKLKEIERLKEDMEQEKKRRAGIWVRYLQVEVDVQDAIRKTQDERGKLEHTIEEMKEQGQQATERETKLLQLLQAQEAKLLQIAEELTKNEKSRRTSIGPEDGDIDFQQLKLSLHAGLNQDNLLSQLQALAQQLTEQAAAVEVLTRENESLKVEVEQMQAHAMDKEDAEAQTDPGSNEDDLIERQVGPQASVEDLPEPHSQAAAAVPVLRDVGLQTVEHTTADKHTETGGRHRDVATSFSEAVEPPVGAWGELQEDLTLQATGKAIPATCAIVAKVIAKHVQECACQCVLSVGGDQSEDSGELTPDEEDDLRARLSDGTGSIDIHANVKGLSLRQQVRALSLIRDQLEVDMTQSKEQSRAEVGHWRQRLQGTWEQLEAAKKALSGRRYNDLRSSAPELESRRPRTAGADSQGIAATKGGRGEERRQTDRPASASSSLHSRSQLFTSLPSVLTEEWEESPRDGPEAKAEAREAKRTSRRQGSTVSSTRRTTVLKPRASAVGVAAQKGLTVHEGEESDEEDEGKAQRREKDAAEQKELELEYRWGMWGEQFVKDVHYRRVFLEALDEVIHEVRELCWPLESTEAEEAPERDTEDSCERALASGNDMELRQLLSAESFTVNTKPYSDKKHGAGIGSHPARPTAEQLLVKKSPLLASVASEPFCADEKIEQVKAIVPLIRQRILFGTNWVDYADELSVMDHEDLADVTALAKNLNKRFLKHQGTAHRIDQYLRTLLKRQRGREAEQAESYHLQQMLFMQRASGAMLGWADKRAHALNRTAFRALRPPATQYLAHRQEYKPQYPPTPCNDAVRQVKNVLEHAKAWG